ncbi:helix-turn-helix domain-containing protein [Proteus sp. ZN5]|nr:helix-turn-helix domain-containing protein [Proteus sp. ZN5]
MVPPAIVGGIINSSFELIPKPLFHYHGKRAACNYLRISSATLNRWIKNGDFPPSHKIDQIIILSYPRKNLDILYTNIMHYLFMNGFNDIR